MSDTKNKNYIKKDDTIDFKKMEKDIAWAMRLTTFTVWFFKAKNILEFISVGI